MQVAEKVYSGKEGYALEAGWPSAGKPNGKAVASPGDQKIAVTPYGENTHGHVSYFTYRKNGWRHPASSRTLVAPRPCRVLWCSVAGE